MIIGILVTDGFEDAEMTTFSDLLGRFEIEYKLIACKDSCELKSYFGLRIIADNILKDVLKEEFDALVLVGGPRNSISLSENKELISFIKSHDEKGRYIFAQCSAPARILGKNGLLKGRHYTCSSNLQNEISDGIYEDLDIVKDGNLATSKGLGVVIDYTLYCCNLLLKDKKRVDAQEEHIYHKRSELLKIREF